MAKNNNSSVNVLMAFLLGGAVGAGLAMLLAPRPGEETRRLLKDQASAAKEEAKKMAEEVKERASQVIEKSLDVVETNKAVLESAIEAGKEAMEKERTRLSEKLEKDGQEEE